MTDNESNVLIFTIEAMTVYKSSDFLKFLKNKSGMPREILFQNRYHPLLLVGSWQKYTFVVRFKDERERGEECCFEPLRTEQKREKNILTKKA